MPNNMWRLGGRIRATNSYLFYNLANIPGFGVAIVDTYIIRVPDFWGTK